MRKIKSDTHFKLRTYSLNKWTAAFVSSVLRHYNNFFAIIYVFLISVLTAE